MQKRLRRRTFLKTTSAALAVGALASSRAYGANERVRAAVVGLKGRGRDHMSGLGKVKGVMKVQRVRV